MSAINNLANTQINFVLVGIASLFALVILIVIYYALSRSKKHNDTIWSRYMATPPVRPGQPTLTTTSNANNQASTSNNIKLHPSASPATANPDMPGQYDGLPPAYLPEFHDTDDSLRGNKPAQVFHISDSIFGYDDAEAVCKAYGAELADYKQMIEAYKTGANWCNPGWVKGQMALYPIQHSFWKKKQENSDPDRRGECGQPGINGGFYQNRHMQFGVNCWGQKRGPIDEERMKHAYQSDMDRELARKVAVFRRQLGNLSLAPFNQDKWHKC